MKNKNRVIFTARDVEDTVGKPNKIITSMNLEDYKGYNAIYNQELNKEATLDSPYENKPEQEAPQEQQEQEKPKEEKETPTFNHSITNGGYVNGEWIEDTESNSQKQNRKNEKMKEIQKKHKLDIPHHMMLSPEELKQKQEIAADRFCQKGEISGGLTGFQKDAGEFMEALIRNVLVDRNDLVDKYYQIDIDRHNKVSLNKEKLMDDFNNKRAKDIANDIDGMELKEDKDEKAVKDMNIPIEEDENTVKVVEELGMLLKFKEENPELEVEKMTQKEKSFFNEVITPATKQFNEKKKNRPEVEEDMEIYKHFFDDETQEFVKQMYAENRYNEERKLENKKEKKKENSMSLDM